MDSKTTIISTRSMVLTALFAAILCVVAPFSITIGPIPLSFATFVIYLAAATLGWKRGTLAVVLYIMLGAVGLPVFSNFGGGFQKIAGLTGGYIIGYIPCAIAIGLIVEKLRRRFVSYVIGMVAGTILLYACGTVWFVLVTGNTLASALLLTAVPFLPGDAAKIVVACIVSPQLNALTRRMG
ncbi:MAG: biotin transporter BioY [Oscillospiraceae bacterium]|nr:biotin transporter BioY [Oscillospiraceae bacterium]